MAALKLIALPDLFAVCKLSASAAPPAWAAAGAFSSLTRSPTELSIVCREQDVPLDVNAERGWRCLRVAGPLEFSLVGILASLLDPLAQAGIAVFVVSTFDTDYLLFKADSFDRAALALGAAGHEVAEESG